MLLRSGRRREPILQDEGEQPAFATTSLQEGMPPLPIVQAVPPPLPPSSSAISPNTLRKIQKLAIPDQYRVKIDEFIKSNIALGISPTLDRIASHTLIDSGGRVNTEQARRYVRLRFPEYNLTRNMPIATAKRNHMRTLFGARLGFYMIDLAFLRKSIAGFSHYQNSCLVIYCCAGTQLMLLETVYTDKSAGSIQQALETCQQRLINHYQRPEGFKRLYSDKEGAMRSWDMQQWLKSNKIEIVFMGEGKSQKSYLAEGAIKRLRIELKRQQIVFGPSFNPYDALPRIEKAHNERKLVIGKRQSLWSPSSVTSATYSDYIRYVYSLEPLAYFSLYSIGDGYIDYRFNLDDTVFLKSRYASAKSIEKRSIRTITNQPYRIAARFTILSANFTLVAYYRILPAFNLLEDVDAESLHSTLYARGLFVPEGALTSE